jgi:pyruvate/2-oxoglutarate dehydrogenase complex dihydrolipoamide dehydrogenase (E3) component
MRLLVLGGGPAGLNAALQGRELGAQVIVIESDRLGGTSINRGPAPVRTLARAARLVHDTQAWPAFGLRGPAPKVDLAATLENAGRVADSAHTEQRLSEHVAAAGVAAERGRIPVNDWLQTNLAHIFAAGDVNGRSMLVPSARHEGRLAAENAVLGTRRQVAHEIVPTGSFTDPEYASVGLTEAQAREGYDCAVAVVGYDQLLRAVIDGHAEGFCKLIVERRHRYLLGAHVLGEYSAEVIQVAAVAMAANLRVEQARRAPAGLPNLHRGPGYGRPAAGPRAGGGPHAAFAERSCPSVPARRKSP